MTNNNFNNQSRYPRNEVRSELAIREENSLKYSIDESNVVEWNSKDKARNLKAKNYNYTAIYAYLMDLICAFVTDYRNVEGAITELDNNYYTIRLKRETVEKYAFGQYTKVRSKFWKSFYKVIAEPKTLIMHTDEGDFLGEPIRILAKLQDGTILKAKNFENLQNATSMIESVQIDFFKPMFKEIIENHPNWIPLPRYLQAIIDTELIENPQLAEWQAHSQFTTYEKQSLTAHQIRLYFLYMTDHNNNIGEFMNINAIEFWQCVHADNIRKVQKKTDEGNLYNQYYLHDWIKSKYELDALAHFHSNLAQKGLIDGINFTTCQSWYDQQSRFYRVAVYRKQPLRNAPAYIEYDEQKQIVAPANEPKENDKPNLMNDYNNWIWEHDEYISFEDYIAMIKNTNAWNEGIKQATNNDYSITNGTYTDNDGNVGFAINDDNNEWPSDIPF